MKQEELSGLQILSNFLIEIENNIEWCILGYRLDKEIWYEKLRS